MRLFDPQNITPRFKYASGSKFREIAINALGKFDLITDVMGSFTYDSEKVKDLLHKMHFLKPGGLILIYSDFNAVIEGKTFIEKMPAFFEQEMVPGMSFSQDNSVMIFRPIKDSEEALRKLDQKLKLNYEKIKFIPGCPIPTFYYDYDL